MSSLARLAATVVAIAVSPALAAEGERHGGPSAAPSSPAAKQEKCEHGVQKSLCARCNPKLAAVYKTKGDWCAEHERPESQCVLCHPELAKKGVK
jgi:invasion protein IalB